MARKTDKTSHENSETETVEAELVDEDVVAASLAKSDAREVAMRPAAMPAKNTDISVEARLLRGVFRVANLTVGTAVQTAQAAVGAGVEIGRQMVQVALDGESQADLAEFAGSRVRELVRDTLGLADEPVREVVSYVPVAHPGSEAARTTAELRRRGDELLALSADVYYTDDVHPAFGFILDQLAPDEARILRFLALNGPQPIVDVRTNRPLGIGSELIGGDLTSVPAQAGVKHTEHDRLYLINLIRLGLVETLADPVLLSRYMVLEVQPVVTDALVKAGRSPKIVRKSLRLTEFGENFCAVCFTLERR